MTGLTRGGYRFVVAITVLSVTHHVDHVLRDVVGWPFGPDVNAFTASLGVYPVIACGLLLSRHGHAGPIFWALLAGGAAFFLVVVHVGPVAGDAVDDIPAQYDSAIADVSALVILSSLVLMLLAHATYEVSRLSRTQQHRPTRTR